MKTRMRELLSIGDAMFSRKRVVDSLWQELALNFYPDRADFTTSRNEGDEYSDHLYASYPVLARRELGNLLSANLRPQSQKWFSLHVGEDKLDEQSEERKYLEALRDIQWTAMYEAATGFVRATKQADHDYATFGNAVIQVVPNSALNGLLYKNYHLRDCAWSENADGVIDVMHRNWQPTARQLKHLFGEDKVSREVKKACEKEPEKKFDCRHILVPSRLYEYEGKTGKKFEYTSIYVERESEHALEEVGQGYFSYVVPRWMTVSGSVYGRSMATSVALPDGRTMQVVLRTIREAGEKFVDPPMLAVADAIRGDIPLYAGGITIADIDYDERMGEVLRPVTQTAGNMPVGFEIAAALREDIRHAFFLDKIQLPEAGTDMTAFEVRRRIEEHIRSASPLFEPVEKDYNNPLCDVTFRVLMAHGAFPLERMPDTLRGSEVKFSFRSPLAEMAEQADAATYVDGLTRIVMPAVQLDPAQMENVNLTESTRAALRAIGWKADWFNDIKRVDQKRAEMQQAAQAAQQMQALSAVGQIAEQGGKAGQAIRAAVESE
jgi:hypothetical protein